MARRLQELNPVTTSTGSSIILIKDSRNGAPQDHQILVNDLLNGVVKTSEVSTTPAINQIPRLVDDGAGEVALPTMSGKNLTDLTLPTATGTVKGVVTISDSTNSTSDATNGVAATPKAVKELNDGKTGRTGDEKPTGAWEFDSTGALRVPEGTTAQRPTGKTAHIRFNSDDGRLEQFDGTDWGPLDEKALSSKTGRTGDESPTGSWSFNSTGALKVPSGTTAEQPTGVAGHLRFNSEQTAFEGFDGTVWGELGGGGGATGGGDDEVFVENDKTVLADYTIPSNKNASSTGPLTINTGVTITVAAGARWVIL